MDERILVFPATLLARIGSFHGLAHDYQQYLALISDNYKFLPRKEAEKNSDYKQLIPYAIFVHSHFIFSYRRGAQLAERRLSGRYSIGIGGHISDTRPCSFDRIYTEALEREINEEIHITGEYSKATLAVINDDSDVVGKTHFGVVHFIRITNREIKARERAITEARFVDVADLKRNIHRYENWSQICIRNIETLMNEGG